MSSVELHSLLWLLNCQLALHRMFWSNAKMNLPNHLEHQHKKFQIHDTMGYFLSDI